MLSAGTCHRPNALHFGGAGALGGRNFAVVGLGSKDGPGRARSTHPVGRVDEFARVLALQGEKNDQYAGKGGGAMQIVRTVCPRPARGAGGAASQ